MQHNSLVHEKFARIHDEFHGIMNSVVSTRSIFTETALIDQGVAKRISTILNN
jgi:hypothetical protein